MKLAKIIKTPRTYWILAFIISMLAGFFAGEPVLLFAVIYGGILWIILLRLYRKQIEKIQLGRRSPAGVYEEGELETTYYLANESNWPLFAPVARDRLPFSAEFVSNARFAGLIGPGQLLSCSYTARCRANFGRYTLGPTALTISDPLGLVEVKKIFEKYQPVTLYPRWEKLNWLPIFGGRRRIVEHTKSSSKTAQGQDFYGLREYQRGDPVKNIHWRSVARHNELIVKQFEYPAASSIHIFIDLHKKRRKGLGAKSTLRTTAHLTASVAAYSIKNGHRVGLHGKGKQNIYLPPRAGNIQLTAIVDTLVDINQEGETTLEHLLAESLPNISEGSSIVLVIPTTRISPKKYLHSLSILEGRRTSVLVLLIDDRNMLKIDGSKADYSRDWTVEELKNSFIAHGAWCRIIDPEPGLAQQFPGRTMWTRHAV
ncbi:MAG: DUF58 domain-containing protein [bacterium]